MHNPPAKPSSVNDETRSMVSNPKLDQILDRYLDDLQNGRACSREELLSKHPEVADELAEYLDGIEMVSGLGVGSDLAPQKLGDFEIIRPIGRGAMGVVYLANQISLKRPVALKILRYSVSGKQATARFEREAELVATLQHPNIVPIYATGKHDNLHFLAMQLIDGPSLSQWSTVEDVERDPSTLAKWGAQVARALAHAHQRDVIHRDVKPSNLLQDEDQKIWLTDFGLARRFDDLRMSMTGAMLGTPNYMSPEQASPSRYPIDHRTDIYSLGATLFELITGRCAFLAETPHAVLAQVLAEEAPPLRELLPDASRDLETILMKCLKKEPSDRYQTAAQLADDLEAFAGGRSIKARRPSIIEQAIRWKRHNQQSVTWAVTAAATAITVLGISVASWIGWANSQLGSLKIESNEGPIVGRLIDADGEPTPTFTIPTQQPMPVKEGRYTLQMWAGGKLGDSQDLFVDHGKSTLVNTKLSDDGVFPERTVTGIPAVLPLDGRDDLVFFHKKGITRVDGQTGKDVWTAEAKYFLSDANALSKAEKESQRNKNMETRESVWRIEWMSMHSLSAYDAPRLPVVAHNFPDINQDGEREVLVASHDHPALFAFDGKTGDLRWHYIAAPTVPESVNVYPHREAGSLHRPYDIGDVDGDGVNDFATTFFSQGNQFYRWIDAVSGKTGQRIWRLEMPPNWFSKGQHNVSQYCEIDPIFGRHHRDKHKSGNGNYHSGVAFRSRARAHVVPWPSILIPAEQNSEADALLLVCGTKLIICDAKTGEATDYNQGKPLELGFIPALTPKLVGSSIEGESPIGVLLCEQVSLPNPNTSTKPVTRFSMWSLETAKEIWHYDAACDPGWTGVKPDWPLVADLNNDSVPEILVADGADLDNRMFSNATGLATLQALDARTGKPIWNSNDVAQIRSQDRQVQRVLLGPDADGDQKEDVYVVSPMSVGRRKNLIFVDILSAANGKLIRTTNSKAPLSEQGSQDVIDLEPPSFLGVGADGHPRLVAATKTVNSNSNRRGTLLISTGTGETTQVGNQLEYPLLADGNADGNLDLFLVKPRSSDRLNESAQLVSLKSFGGREHKISSGRFVRSDDVDGDGVRDLVTAPLRGESWQALSGATGERLWQWEYQTPRNRTLPLNSDVDGDNINDYLTTKTSYDSYGDRLLATVVSGHGGRMLWQTDLPPTGFGDRVGVKCEDMNADGVNDVLLIHRFSQSPNTVTNASLRLSCFDGKSGAEHWNCELAAAGSGVSGASFKLDNYPIQIVDLNDDGSPDVLCRRFAIDGTSKITALSGLTGKSFWQQAGADAKLTNTLQFPPWRAKVLATGPDKQQQFVTAAAHEDRRGAERTVKVTFYDSEHQQPASSWSGEGRFKRYPQLNGDPPGLWNGIPFEIAAGEKRYTGVCLQDRNLRELQIVVLDSSQGEAIEVQRIVVPLPENVGSGHAWVGQFLIADVNQDGQTDIIFHDGSDLVATDLISNTEVNRKPMPTDYRHLKQVDLETSLIHMTTNTHQDARLKLIDLETFDIVWDVRMPEGAVYEGLLSGGQPDRSNVYSTIPRLFHRNKAGTMRSIATAAEYMGLDKSLKQQISLAASEPIDFAADRYQDPRMIEPLPWAGVRAPENFITNLLPIATNSLLIVLGAFVVPFFYVRYLASRKHWSLQTFLLLPLLFVIPFLVLQLPLEANGDQPAHRAVREFGVPLWIGKVMIASLILPAVVFVAAWIKSLWCGNWKRWIELSMAAIVMSIAIGGLTLLAHSFQLPAGNQYDWYDWWTLMLLAHGSWVTGLGVIAIWIFVTTGRFVSRLAKRIFSRPTLASS